MDLEVSTLNAEIPYTLNPRPQTPVLPVGAQAPKGDGLLEAHGFEGMLLGTQMASASSNV